MSSDDKQASAGTPAPWYIRLAETVLNKNGLIGLLFAVLLCFDLYDRHADNGRMRLLFEGILQNATKQAEALERSERADRLDNAALRDALLQLARQKDK